MKIEKNASGFPCMPMQDSLGRFFSPISGFTKYEYVCLEIYKSLINNIYNDMDSESNESGIMEIATHFADAYFDKLNELENEKNNISTIIQ